MGDPTPQWKRPGWGRDPWPQEPAPPDLLPGARNLSRGSPLALLQPPAPLWPRTATTPAPVPRPPQGEQQAPGGSGTCSALGSQRPQHWEDAGCGSSAGSLCAPLRQEGHWPAPGPGHKQEGGNPARLLWGQAAQSLPASDLLPGEGGRGSLGSPTASSYLSPSAKALPPAPTAAVSAGLVTGDPPA